MTETFDASTIPQTVETVLREATKLPEKHFYWYRGVACADYKLIPGLMRGDPRDMKHVFEREMRLITRFRQRSLPYWSEGYPQTDWEHLFSMQHHGVPTRLLDWTENFFVGLHFALMRSDGDEKHKLKHHPERDCVPTVWLLDPKTWNRRALAHQADEANEISVLTSADDELKFYIPETSSNRFNKRYKTPVAVYGTHNSTRIVAQRGTFTIAGNEWKGLEEFDSSIEKPELGGLKRIHIKMNLESARKQLEALGFTESMIYPDLPGLARELSKSEDWR